MTKTTCPEHRRQGYYFTMAGALLCKGCNLPAEQHETNGETLARREREGQ